MRLEIDGTKMSWKKKEYIEATLMLILILVTCVLPPSMQPTLQAEGMWKIQQIKDEVDLTGLKEKGSIREAGRNGRRGM